VRGYTQVHLFAGIGGWSYAARLAGWPDDRPLWTGSCPCQPFSAAGKQKGTTDARHLWPEMRRLVTECRPPVVAGEQVASHLGRNWLAGVRTDLEALGYAVGAADLCAASVGAPHIRQRLWWVAESQGDQQHWGREARQGRGEPANRGRVDNATTPRRKVDGWGQLPLKGRSPNGPTGASENLAGGLGDADHAGPQGRRDDVSQYASKRTPWASSLDNWLPCLDGKARRIEPGLEPLAHGAPNRVGRLRGYGNAIVPQVAARFLTAYLDTQG
jgi:DNA (cytosine-5)-methyltransferase 1